MSQKKKPGMMVSNQYATQHQRFYKGRPNVGVNSPTSAMDSSAHIKIHDEVDDQVVINDSFDTDIEKHQATLVQKRLMAHQANFFKMRQCFDNFKNTMIQVGSVKQVDQIVVPTLEDKKDEKIRELEIKLKQMAEENKRKDDEISRLKSSLLEKQEQEKKS